MNKSKIHIIKTLVEILKKKKKLLPPFVFFLIPKLTRNLFSTGEENRRTEKERKRKKKEKGLRSSEITFQEEKNEIERNVRI